MSDHDPRIDDTVRQALRAEVAGVHADEQLLDRIRARDAGAPGGPPPVWRALAAAAAVVLVLGAVSAFVVAARPADTRVATEGTPAELPSDEEPVPPAQDDPEPDEPVDDEADDASDEEHQNPDATEPEALPAATTTTTVPEEVDHGAHLRDRSYQASSVTEDGHQRHLAHEGGLRVSFGREGSDDIVTWFAGCNGGGAKVMITADRLVRSEDLGSTARGCHEDVEDDERRLGAFFRADPYWRLEGARLTLWTADTIIELTEVASDT